MIKTKIEKMDVNLLKEWLEFFTRKCGCKIGILKNKSNYLVKMSEGEKITRCLIFNNFDIKMIINGSSNYPDIILKDFIKTAMELAIIGNKPDFGYLK